MSFLFKFIDSGFLLTLGLILLISGGIMLYCYRRLNLLERSVIEHGKILQNFIINYNIQMQGLSLVNKSHYNVKNDIINDESNRTEYVEFDKIKKINLGEKISVSDDDEDNEDDEDAEEENHTKEGENDPDDDDDDDDDEDDDDEDDEDEDDDDDDDDDDAVETRKSNIDIRKDTSESLTISNNKLEELGELEDLEDLEDLENIKLHEQNISNSDDEAFLKNLPINLNSFTLEITNDPKIITLENIDNTNDKTGERKNYSKMKVDDLKTLVVTKNLIDNESAQKMKKSDLVKLLQK